MNHLKNVLTLVFHIKLNINFIDCFRILGRHPNCYTFTKALAEHEVAKSIKSFPSCIIRPSMSK